MSSCVEIMLRKSPAGLPLWCYDDNGRVFLDVGDLELSKTKKREQLNEFNQITGAGILGFLLPRTDKNSIILAGYGCATHMGFNHKAKIPVIVRECGLTKQQNMISVLRKNRAGWEVELTDGSDFWKEAFEGFAMCDIPYDDIFLDEAFLRNNWANEFKYNDGDNGIWFPLVHYGNWTEPALYDSDGNLTQETSVTIADFRPWIHVLGAIQKAFCAIGWEFSSPILESEELRHWISYALRNFNDFEDIEIGFKASTSADETFNQLSTLTDSGGSIDVHWVRFDDDSTGDNFDTGAGTGAGYFDTALGNHYASGLSGTYDVEICININNTSGVAALMNFYLVQDSVAGSPTAVNIGTQASVAIGPSLQVDPGQNTICFTYLDVPIVAGRFMRLYVDMNPFFADPNQFIQAGSYMKVSPKTFQMGENIILPVSQILDCNLSFLDWFKGVIHATGGGNLVTDYFCKKVTLYQPYGVEMRDGSTPEPFFKDETTTGIEIICGSEQLEIKQELQNRFVRLKFCDPEDARVKDLGYGPENPLHGRVVDLGEGFVEDTTDNPNPTFEASSMIRAVDLLNPPRTFNGDPVDTDVFIPALWDNTDNKVSTDIKARLMRTAPTGLVQQYRGVDDLAAPVLAEWAFKRDLNNLVPTESPEDQIPYAYHLNTELIGPDAANLVTLEDHIIYGSESLDLFEMFWLQRLQEISNSFDSKYRAIIDICLFDRIQYRRKWLIEYEGKKFEAYPTTIENFQQCPRGIADITLTPIVKRDKTC